MLQVVAYALAISVALSLAGFCAEKIVTMLGRSRRFFWAATMVLSILWPLGMMLWARPVAVSVSIAAQVVAQQPVATPMQPAAPVALAMLRGAEPQTVTPVQAQEKWQLRLPSDRTMLLAWAVASGLLLLLLAGTDLLLHYRASRWQRETVLGRQVQISEATGPALLGAMRPQIVVPRWFLDEPAATQSLILEHEQQHIAAHDPLLLRLALLIVALVPWNLPLWWQLRRLRQAIELDCDARVLRAGAEAASYGEVLLAVTRRAGNLPVNVIAMGEPVSALERRIRHLTAGPACYSAPQALAALAFWGIGIGVAFALQAPPLPRSPAKIVDHGEAAVSLRRLEQASPPVAIKPAAVGALTAPERATSGGDAQALPRLPAPIHVSAAPLDSGVAAPPYFVTRALLKQYPELGAASEQAVASRVEIVLRTDGTVYTSRLSALDDPGSLPSVFTPDMGATNTAILRGGTTLPGGASLRAPVFVRYVVMSDHFDGSRSRENTAAAVLAARPDLLLPFQGNGMNLVTVFMTEDGKVDRVARKNGAWSMNGFVPGGIVPEVLARQWETLGLRPEQLGQMGLTYVNDNGRDMTLLYAWPRHPGEPMGGAMPNDGNALRVAFTDTDAATVIEHYLPGALSGKGRTPARIPWLLLTKQGEVVKSGYVPRPDSARPVNPKSLIEAANPNVRAAFAISKPVVKRPGESWADEVIFAWNALPE